jgi:hypothetical protein
VRRSAAPNRLLHPARSGAPRPQMRRRPAHPSPIERSDSPPADGCGRHWRHRRAGQHVRGELHDFPQRCALDEQDAETARQPEARGTSGTAALEEGVSLWHNNCLERKECKRFEQGRSH